MVDKPPGGGMQDLVIECITHRLPARDAPDRQCNPLSDHRKMTGFEDRPGGLLQTAQIVRHFLWIIASSAAIRPGNQDQESARRFGHEFLPSILCRMKP